MARKNECYAYFKLEGSFQPDQITKRIGVTPTKSFLQGDLIPRTQMARKLNGWQLHSRLEKTAKLELHVSDVLAQLDANRSGFKRISPEFGGVMELVGYFHADYPGLTFDREVVERLAEYSLSVDCDFYFLAEEDQNPERNA
jgi:Domain of unknown function (DUF4279)